MQFSHAFLALLAAGLASAQLPNVPNCSLNCFVLALTSDGCPSIEDFACHCQKPELVGKIQPCVQKDCSIPDQSIVSSVVVSQCSAVGHPISVPPVEGASTTVSQPTTTESLTQTDTATATATATPTATGITSGPSPTASSTGATDPGASSSGVSSSSAISSSHHVSSTPTTTPTPSSSVSESPSASTTTTLSNDAGSTKGGVMGIAAMAAAALYLL